MTISSPSMSSGAPRASGGPVVLHGVSWERYEALVELLGNAYPSLRLTYWKARSRSGRRLPSTSEIKKLIARLLELWALGATCASRIRCGHVSPARQRARPRAGRVLRSGRADRLPDIAIEVVHEHGGIDKLEVYAGLAVPEVWFWQDGELIAARAGRNELRAKASKRSSAEPRLRRAERRRA
jgi:hypothetical protein